MLSALARLQLALLRLAENAATDNQNRVDPGAAGYNLGASDAYKGSAVLIREFLPPKHRLGLDLAMVVEQGRAAKCGGMDWPECGCEASHPVLAADLRGPDRRPRLVPVEPVACSACGCSFADGKIVPHACLPCVKS